MAKAANKVFDSTAGPAGTPAPVTKPVDVLPTDGEHAAERTDFPCSIAQERFWLLDRLDPGNSAYNVAVRWRLEGRVATDLLERSWLKIIERHEVLRTVFMDVDGAPIQRVMPRASFRLNEIDLSTLSAELQQTEADRIGVIEARAPFDLASGPVIRATLLRFSPTVSVILVTTHQIVSDGWSIGIMAREMGLIYKALRHGAQVELEPLPIQYADYSEWQLEWLKVRGTEAETAYWTRQLAGVKQFKVLPDHARPAMPTTSGAIASRVLPRELTNRAQALSAEHGATLFATAFAALCVTLARLTNETEIVVGTQVSDRDQVELEPMIGQFVNSLILRNDLSGNPEFGAVIERVRDTIAQALENRHIPIERLLGMVKSERSDPNSPPISVNFIFQKTFIHNTDYGDFALIDMPSLPTGTIYHLNIFMVERPDGWRFSCQYDTDQFAASTAERLLEYYQHVLNSAVTGGRRLSDLTLAAPNEARLVLGRLNDRRTLYPRDLTLVKLFKAQVMRAPEAPAVVFDDRHMTYAGLDAAADRVAQHLASRGVVPGMRVGISLVRSMQWPICMLAVLKAGAAFVPLDPADPPQWQAEQIAASGIDALIGIDLGSGTPAEGSPFISIDVEAALASKPGAASKVRDTPSNAEAPAYVAATAGGTAMRQTNISHRNLSNLIGSMAKRPGIGDRDIIVTTSHLTADHATLEIFLPLLTGARLVIATEKERDSGPGLLNLLQRSSATAMYGDPQVWTHLLRAQWTGHSTMKMLCSTRELQQIPVGTLCSTGGELWALYGRPEAGVWSSIQRINSEAANPPLGEPIANTALYVLDAYSQIAPIGSVGRIFVGGDGLSDDAMPDSVLDFAGARLFATGDLGRISANGQIEFLGRADECFMHRGHWVNPALVECALAADPGVLEVAVAVARNPTGTGEAALVAYATASSATPEGRAELAAALENRLMQFLPVFLQPTQVVVRDSLPRTPSGAIDRHALTALKARATDRPISDPLSGEIAERLSGIWAKMLGIPSIGADDNFFEMGGHSLLAARMLTHIEREFGRRIRLSALFMAPTVRQFAKVLAQHDLRDFDFRQVVKIQPHGSKRPLIAVNNTGVYYTLAKHLGPDQPVYSLQLFDPSVKTATMPESLEEIARGYVDLIRRVQPQGPYELMGWCVAGALAFEIARQLDDQKQEVSDLFLIDSWVPGYFDRLPRVRGTIAALSLRAHLIFADWCRVLARETSMRNFINNRTIFKKLRALFSDAAAVGESNARPEETYDQWLLTYLQGLSARYVPRPYHGKITLFRSKREPTGFFFKEHAGWGDFTAAGVDVRFIDGNHFTMFQDPGAAQMAACVASVLDVVSPQASPASQS